jgi:hypothetical protein
MMPMKQIKAEFEAKQCNCGAVATEHCNVHGDDYVEPAPTSEEPLREGATRIFVDDVELTCPHCGAAREYHKASPPPTASFITRAAELRDKWRNNGESPRLINRGDSVELRASEAQMKEIHQNWNRIATKVSGDDSLWHTVEAIADIMFREVPARQQYGQPNAAGCSMLTCADELDALLAEQGAEKLAGEQK